MRRIACVLASFLTLAACASEPRRPPSSLDPSSPDAPEAPPVSLSGTLAAAPPSEPAHEGHGQHGTAAPRDAGTSSDAASAVYVCPMHPEVRSDTPGKCPKCGMKLVPEQPRGAGQPDSGSGGHEHGHGAHP
ncbi:heavy metal-binding domain-containing protein [Pyxidicoccus sp. 3LG]